MFRHLAIAFTSLTVVAIASPPEPKLVVVRDDPRCILMLGDPTDDTKLTKVEDEFLKSLIDERKHSGEAVEHRVFMFRGRPGQIFGVAFPLPKGEIQIHRNCLDDDYGQFLTAEATIKFIRENGMDPDWNTCGKPFKVRSGMFRLEVKLEATPHDVPLYPRRTQFVTVEIPKSKSGQQDGADQPATAPESKSEGNERAKPESEVRSQ